MKELFITIKNGEIIREKSDNVRYCIKHMIDGLYIMRLSRVGTRNQKQNRYYRGVVLKLIADHTGEEREEIHEYFKQMFLLDEEEPSTREKNKSEFCLYVDLIKDYALTERNILIPDPIN